MYNLYFVSLYFILYNLTKYWFPMPNGVHQDKNLVHNICTQGFNSELLTPAFSISLTFPHNTEPNNNHSSTNQ